MRLSGLPPNRKGFFSLQSCFWFVAYGNGWMDGWAGGQVGDGQFAFGIQGEQRLYSKEDGQSLGAYGHEPIDGVSRSASKHGIAYICTLQGYAINRLSIACLLGL